jgi:hypothetical protein
MGYFPLEMNGAFRLSFESEWADNNASGIPIPI